MHKSHSLSVFAFAKPTGRTERCDYGKQRELSSACTCLCVGAMIAGSLGITTSPVNGEYHDREGRTANHSHRTLDLLVQCKPAVQRMRKYFNYFEVQQITKRCEAMNSDWKTTPMRTKKQHKRKTQNRHHAMQRKMITVSENEPISLS